jgi:polysaccharide export outer membrane protein
MNLPTVFSFSEHVEQDGGHAPGRWPGWLSLLVLLGLLGCASPTSTPVTEQEGSPYSSGNVQIGDVVKVTFPGAPTLNMTQTVHLDGMMDLPPNGSIKVEGKTTTELEQEILKLYESQLQLKQVNVTVETQGYPVFVTGAVLKPGKITCTRSVTVLEAIMEAGGFDPNRANLKKVQVIRKADGSQKSYILDLKQTLDSPTSNPFYLRPSDIVYVPERFAWF